MYFKQKLNCRRLIRDILIFVLVFLIFPDTAWAAPSIFDQLPEGPSAEVIPKAAPSYGNISGMPPDKEAKNIYNDTVLTYNNVRIEDFNDFGVYLGERDFYVTEQQVQGAQYAYRISDGNISFSMIYDNSNHVMNTIYPSGTEYEQIMFPGCRRIWMGKTLNMPEHGKFIFKQFQMKSTGLYTTLSKESRNRKKYQYPFSGAVVIYDYFNTTPKTKKTESATTLDEVVLGSLRLVYQNNEDHLVFYTRNHAKSFDGVIAKGEWTILSNEQTEMGISFELPDAVIKSTDGNLGLLMDNRSTGEQYVLVLRENGKNLY